MIDPTDMDAIRDEFAEPASETLYQHATIEKGGATLYWCDARNAAFTVTLPPAQDMKDVTLRFIKIDSSVNTVTLKAFGNTQTINGSTSNTDMDAEHDVMCVISTGTEWIIVFKTLN
jgi:hypothetical protein